jgi:pyruvate kinase
MVARGDLGVEMRLPEVPLAQKRIVRRCRETATPCVVATQMLESMTHARRPTRAEVTDVANAVLDGADAVMLSGETAIGEDPVAAVTMMNDIATSAEDYQAAAELRRQFDFPADPTTAAVAAAAAEAIRQDRVRAAAVYTATGTTARLLSNHRLGLPVLAIAPDRRVVRQMGLLYGVQAVEEPAPEHTREVLALVDRHVKALCLGRAGDRVVVLSGRPIGRPGATNTLVVHTIA